MKNEIPLRPPATGEVSTSYLLAALVEKARACKVPRVVAATQNGTMGMILADGGPNNNGILYRDDTTSHAARAALAEQINSALANTEDRQPEPETSNQPKH